MLTKFPRVVFCEAYKIGLYGSRIQWLIVGDYSAQWWGLAQPGLGCSAQQVGTSSQSDNNWAVMTCLPCTGKTNVQQLKLHLF